MAGKSSIKKLSSDQRKYIEKLLRQDTHTLDEMVALIKAEFPEEKNPSRSALGRYSVKFDQMAARMKEIQSASRVLVAELGEDTDDKMGGLMVQAITSLATHAALQAAGSEEEIDIKEIGQLARTARAVMETRKMSLAERQEIERIAREKLLAEQEAELEKQVKTAGLSDDTANLIRAKILGVSV